MKEYSKPVVMVLSARPLLAACRQGNTAFGCMGGSRVDQDVKVVSKPDAGPERVEEIHGS